MRAAKTNRRVLNRCLFLCLIFLYISQGFSSWLHIVLGIIFLVLVAIHIAKYAKWIKASTKAFFKQKLKNQAKKQYLIIGGMLIAFLVIVLSGFVSAYELMVMGEVNGVVHRIHTVFAIMGGFLVAPHLASWISKRRKAANRQRGNSQKQCG